MYKLDGAVAKIAHSAKDTAKISKHTAKTNPVT